MMDTKRAVKDFDLADGRDREVLTLVVHADLLKRDDLLSLRLLRHVHLPVCALPDLFRLLEAVDASRAATGMGDGDDPGGGRQTPAEEVVQHCARIRRALAEDGRAGPRGRGAAVEATRDQQEPPPPLIPHRR